MKPATRHEAIPGPAGSIECAIDEPLAGPEPKGVAILCHPHPQHGGTMDNKVVQTLARAFVQLGHRAVRFNFRGVGASHGHWDDGRGEVDDASAVVNAWRLDDAPLAIGGFSFGAYVASQVAAKLPVPPDRLVLIAPAVQSFEVAPVPAGTCVIHGEHDDVVPLGAVLDWARPQALPVTVVPGTGHFFHGQLTLLKNILLSACR